MGESLNENSSSPQSILTLPACIDESQGVDAAPVPVTLCNHNAFINEHSKHAEIKKRRGKRFPPPLTAALLKSSRQKLQTPLELVFTSDDDDDDPAAADAAITQRLLSIGKKYLSNRNGKLTKAEKAQLNDTENPRPSTSTALIREMNRIQIAFQKASQSPSSVKLSKVKVRVHPTAKPPCSPTLRVQKTVSISKIRESLKSNRDKTEAARRKRKTESLEESNSDEDPPEWKKTKEDINSRLPSEPMERKSESSLPMFQLNPHGIVKSKEVEFSGELVNHLENDKGTITIKTNHSEERLLEVDGNPRLRLRNDKSDIPDDGSQQRRSRRGAQIQTNQIVKKKIRAEVVSPPRKLKKLSEIEAFEESEVIRRSSRERRPRQNLDDSWIYI